MTAWPMILLGGSRYTGEIVTLYFIVNSFPGEADSANDLRVTMQEEFRGQVEMSK